MGFQAVVTSVTYLLLPCQIHINGSSRTPVSLQTCNNTESYWQNKVNAWHNQRKKYFSQHIILILKTKMICQEYDPGNWLFLLLPHMAADHAWQSNLIVRLLYRQPLNTNRCPMTITLEVNCACTASDVQHSKQWQIMAWT